MPKNKGGFNDLSNRLFAENGIQSLFINEQECSLTHITIAFIKGIYKQALFRIFPNNTMM
nr:hypothetical protein [Pedobacter sp. ASV2]